MILGLRAKVGLLATALAVLPPALVGAGLIDVNEDTLATAGRDFRLAVAEDASNTVDSILSDGETGLVAVAAALANPDLDGDGRVAAALALVEANETLDHAAVFRADGTFVDLIAELDLPPGAAPASLSPELRRTAETDGVAVGRPLAADEVRLPVVVPLRGDGGVRGYVEAQISLERLQRRLAFLAEHRFGGETASLFIVDDQRRIVAHPDPEVARSLRSAAHHPALQSTEVGSEASLAAISGDFIGEDGREMVGSVVPMRRLPWTVVTQVPRDVAYASIVRMRWIVGLGTAAAVLVALVLAWIFSGRLIAPIGRLVTFAAALSERRFDAAIDVETGDELQTLGEAMSKAARDLADSEAQLREESAIRNDLGRYLPRELVERVVEREQDMALGGDRRTITVLFADVVGFTPLTTQLEAEEVVALLNDLFTLLTEIVFRHGGTVDKFIGDCVMAFWGAPTEISDHAERAVAAAEEMMRFLEVGNAGWSQTHGVTIELAIGVNTGEAVVGNIGSSTRMEYTAIGDVVNVAARLEAIARPQQILVTGATYAAAGSGFDFVSFGPREVAGRVGEVDVYEVAT